MADFSLKTKFTDGGEVYLLSTVRLHFYNFAPYETMLFRIEKTELATRICIVNAIRRSKKPKKDTKIYSYVLSEEKCFGKQYDAQTSV